MTWTVRVPNWGELQHYKKRGPPWIKLHARLSVKREWRELHGSAAKLLVDLWLVASEHEDGEITLDLDDLAWRFRIPEAELVADIQVLESRRLVEVASECLQDASARLRDAIQRRGEERRAETEQRESNTAADAAETEPTDRYTAAFRALLPVIRERLWLGKPPAFKDQQGHPWSEGRECTVIRQLLNRKHSVDDLRELIEGLVILRDYNGLYTDPVSWLSPACQISLRVLFKAASGASPVVVLARTAFEKHQARRPKKQSSPEGVNAFDGLPGAA